MQSFYFSGRGEKGGHLLSCSAFPPSSNGVRPFVRVSKVNRAVISVALSAKQRVERRNCIFKNLNFFYTSRHTARLDIVQCGSKSFRINTQLLRDKFCSNDRDDNRRSKFYLPPSPPSFPPSFLSLSLSLLFFSFYFSTIFIHQVLFAIKTYVPVSLIPPSLLELD